MFVLQPADLVTRAAGRRADYARAGNVFNPSATARRARSSQRSGSVELGGVGRRVRRAPDAFAAPRSPPAAATASQNALPCSYWRSFSSRPSSRASSVAEAAAAAAARVQPARAASAQLGADRPRRRRPSRARRGPRSPPSSPAAGRAALLLGPASSASELAAQHANGPARAGRAAAACASVADALRVEPGRRVLEQLARRVRARCGREPRRPASNWIAWVVSCSATQRRKSSRSAPSSSRPRQVRRRRTAAAAAGSGRSGRRRTGRAPAAPRSRPRPRPRPRAPRRRPRSGDRRRAGRAGGGRRRCRARAARRPRRGSRARSPPSSRAVDELGDRRGAHVAEARVGRGGLDRALTRELDLGRREGSAARWPPRPGTAGDRGSGDPLGEAPVDDPAHADPGAAARCTSSSVASISSSRPAAIVVARVEVERRRRGQPRPELDRGAGLAGDQLAGGGVDRAAGRAREHAVEARRGDVAERDRDRADRPMR